MKYIWDKPKMKFVPADEYKRPYVGTNVMPDIQDYRSIIDGSRITSRSHHRAHMRQHGVEEVGNERIFEKIRPKYEPKDVGRDVYQAFEELS